MEGLDVLSAQVHIGITGTRKGWTDLQRTRLFLILRTHNFTHWNHGLCVGVDTESHWLMREWFPEAYIVGHPPIKTNMIGEFGERAFDELRKPKTYLTRN